MEKYVEMNKGELKVARDNCTTEFKNKFYDTLDLLENLITSGTTKDGDFIGIRVNDEQAGFKFSTTKIQHPEYSVAALINAYGDEETLENLCKYYLEIVVPLYTVECSRCVKDFIIIK